MHTDPSADRAYCPRPGRSRYWSTPPRVRVVVLTGHLSLLWPKIIPVPEGGGFEPSVPLAGPRVTRDRRRSPPLLGKRISKTPEKTLPRLNEAPQLGFQFIPVRNASRSIPSTTARFRMIMSRSGGGAGTMPKPQLPMIAVVTPSEVFSGGRGRPDRKRVLHADEEPQLARPPHHRLPDEAVYEFPQAETPTVAAAYHFT